MHANAAAAPAPPLPAAKAALLRAHRKLGGVGAGLPARLQAAAALQAIDTGLAAPCAADLEEAALAAFRGRRGLKRALGPDQ